MGSSNLTPILPSPPPYSRTHHRTYRYPRFLNVPLPLLSLICFIISLNFFLLPRYFFTSSETPNKIRLNEYHIQRLENGLAKCRDLHTPPVQYDIEGMLRGEVKRENPRWNAVSGQKVDLFLKNATLFDGEAWVEGPVNIWLSKGVITAISPTSTSKIQDIPDVEASSFIEMDLQGKYVTPGLIDMHSHHYISAWPAVNGVEDDNEMHQDTGPLTPMMRVLDGLKAWDVEAEIIASGGITSSLILPGSANIMGGEGIMVKNVLKSGKHGEPVVEEILLEHGIEVGDRRKYMKMACGENPKGVYGPGRTRMGNAWKLRHQMERARDLLNKQDEWCLAAAAARESGTEAAVLDKKGDLPEELELESSVAMLRGKIGVNVHCYEPQDFEDMILHAKEFGFRVQAFHHALEAWKVPEMIKDSGMNITVATFAEFGLMKKEAYGSNLWAGSILAEHGVPVAYKSDHSMSELNAKYLLHQASTAHAFHLPEDLALQSVTSVPAKSLEQDHRIGYARTGYDADIVVWDSHPLSVGATPLQVFIDGKATLDTKKVEDSMPKASITSQTSAMRQKPRMKPKVAATVKDNLCSAVEKPDEQVIIKGIAKSYLYESYSHQMVTIPSAEQTNLTIILTNNKITCFAPDYICSPKILSANPTIITLENGHVLPGLIALTNSMGVAEMTEVDSTMDGTISQKSDPLSPESVVYAKYGLHLEGKTFGRARIGGVTRAITAPYSGYDGHGPGGFLKGVSVGFKTGRKRGLLNGGIFRDEVGLHFSLAQTAKETDAVPTISTAVAKFRKILSNNKGKDSIYGRASNGSIPLVVYVENKHEILQLIKIKNDYPDINLVIYGGSGAPFVAKEIAQANIPVILTANRGAPESWEMLDTLTGPPLTKSAAAVLSEAGVEFGIAIISMGDTHIHNLAIEASWTAKYAGLSDRAAVDLVSRKIEKILGLDVGKKESEKDFVIWEGDPLGFGASVVLAVDGGLGEVMECWPEGS